MKYRLPHTLLLIILLAPLFPAKAQQIAWSVDMTGFFDNREFGYSKAQTPPNSECRWVCFPVPN